MIGTDIAWLIVPLAYDLQVLGNAKRPNKKRLGVLGPYLTLREGGYMKLHNGVLVTADEQSPIEVFWTVNDTVECRLVTPSWSCETRKDRETSETPGHRFIVRSMTGDEDKMRAQLTLLRVFIHGYVPR